MCGYADERTRDSVGCGEPEANPCASGRSTDGHPGSPGGHSHASWPAGKEATQACIDYMASIAPPPPPPPPDNPEDDPEDDPPAKVRWACCEGTAIYIDPGEDGPAECASLLRQIPDACPIIDPPDDDEDDPPPPDDDEDDPRATDEPTCTCCEGVVVTRDEGRTCGQECGSLLRQIPDACPAPPVVPPPVVPPTVPAVEEPDARAALRYYFGGV